jgi:putative ABC transport system ATP-binding protein
MIALRNITKIYPSGADELTVLQDVSLQIEQGDFVSIMGPSGSGKSTLMHIMGCLDIPSYGEYVLNGVEVSELSGDELARIRNRQIGFVFQNFFLLPRMTALKNVELPLVYRGMSKRERLVQARQLLTQVGLQDRLHHLPNELSGGQKQRVAIARALANEPAIVLADEPTGALDQTTGAEIMHLFRELNQGGVTIVIITHDPAVAKVADRVVHLVDGKVVKDERGGASSS